MTEKPLVRESSTKRIGDFALIPLSAIPQSTLNATRRIVLDTLACAIGASGTQQAEVITAFKREKAGPGEATVVVSGDRISCGGAAYVNAQLANLLDADETFLNFSHFASAIVMPALAVAEREGGSATEFLAAVAIGFEVAARVALGLRDLEVSPSGTVSRTKGSGFSWAALGAAAAAGRLLGLTSERIQHALGLAYVTAPLHGCLVNYTSTMGSRVTPWHKYSMYGAIAEAGADAALLAGRGFMADPTILDRGSEFWRPLGGNDFDWDELDVGLGESWWIEQTSLKPFPFCRYGHGVLGLLRDIVQEQHLTANDVEEVVATIPAFPPLEVIACSYDPRDQLDIMSSLPFAAALILTEVAPGPQWWADKHLADPQLREISRRFHHRVSPQWGQDLARQIESEGKFRRFPVEVEVVARTGRWTKATQHAQGDPWSDDTVMSDEQLSAKVNEYCAAMLGEDGAEHLTKVVLGLGLASDLDDAIRATVAKPAI